MDQLPTENKTQKGLENNQVNNNIHKVLLPSWSVAVIVAVPIILIFSYLALAKYVIFTWPFEKEYKSKTLVAEINTNNQLNTNSLESSDDVVTNHAILQVDWNKNILQTKIQCTDGVNCTGDRYELGIIKNGEFIGQKLYMVAASTMGGYDFQYSVLNNGEFKDLGGEVQIKGVTDLPDEIKLPNASYYLKKGWRSELFSNLDIDKELFFDPRIGEVYITKDGCFMVRLPDETALNYDLVLPFYNESDGNVDFAFNNGLKNQESYNIYAITGCGALCRHLTVVDDTSLPNSLVPVGKITNGELIYSLADNNDQRLVDLYNDKNTVAYYSDAWDTLTKSRYSYKEFLDYLPYIYWRDPFDNWVQLTNKRFEYAAEMCKPVIYLYPTQKTSVEVKVNPNGGFTYANPIYGNGWKVSVEPNGQITNLIDGQKFPYLFWEGIGLGYPIMDKGWVIKQDNLSEFFDSTLPLLGMNSVELADFKEYWLNRLIDYPYYQISFVDPGDFNKIAPLTVGPVRPNTIIRIMMTAKGLNVFKVIPQQELKPVPYRNGFTVLEWGGAVLK